MRRDHDFVADIIISADRVASYLGGMTEADLLHDNKTQDAVIYRLQIIGEAARNLSVDFKDGHGDIPWSGFVGMRNILAHKYHDLILTEIWKAATIDVPDLARRLTGTTGR